MVDSKKKGKKCLIVEGNIGVGKSSFLKLLAQRLDCKVVFEPHEKWQQIGGAGNLLEKFYEDTPRWAYTFQSYAFLSRVLEQEEAVANSEHEVIIFERSVFSDLHCFAKNCFELGTMTSLEWNLYQECFSWLVKLHAIIPTGFIYLRGKPQVCFDRLKIRNRKEESEVPLSYLELLHHKHDDWLVQRNYVADCVANVPVLTLNRDVDWHADPSEKDRLIGKVAEFFNVGCLPFVRSAEKSSSLSL
ncbi:deoxynucleoside kinase [Candidatus Dependentiae bacterium]